MDTTNLSPMERGYALDREIAGSQDNRISQLEKDIFGAPADELLAKQQPQEGPAPKATPPANELSGVATRADELSGGKPMKQFAAGAVDVARGAVQAGHDLINSVDNWLTTTGIKETDLIDDDRVFTFGKDLAPPSTTDTERAFRGAGKFVTQFATAIGTGVGAAAMAAPGIVSVGASAAAAGVSSYFTADPHEGNIANFVQRFPMFQNGIVDYWAAKETDTEAEGRFKNFVTSIVGDAALAGVFVGAMKVYKSFRGVSKVGTEVAEGAAGAAAKTEVKVTAENTAVDKAGQAIAPSVDEAQAIASKAAQEGATEAPLDAAATARGHTLVNSGGETITADASAVSAAVAEGRGVLDAARVVEQPTVMRQAQNLRMLSLEELQAPATEATKRFNLDNVPTMGSVDDFRRVVSNIVAANKEGFETIARGVVSDESVLADAFKLLGEDVSRLTTKVPGQGWNAVEVKGAGIFFVNAVQDSVEKAIAAAAPNASDEVIAAFERSKMLTLDSMALFKAGTKEAGLATRAADLSNVTAFPVAEMFAAKDVLTVAGGKEQIQKQAATIVDMMSRMSPAEKVKHFSWMSNRSRLGHLAAMGEELRVMSLLSGPLTQTVNVANNLVNTIGLIPEKYAAWAVQKMRSIVGGKGNPATRLSVDELSSFFGGMPAEEIDATYTAFANKVQSEAVSLAESNATVLSLGQGLKEGWIAYFKAWRTSDPLLTAGGSKLMALERPSTLTGAANGLHGVWADAMDFIGSGIRIPGRALNAADVASKATIYRMQTNALAVRTARAAGLTGDAYTKMVKEMTQFPPAHINMMAAREAGQRTLNYTPEIFTKLYDGISQNPMFRMLVPFTKININQTDQVLQRFPGLAMLTPGFKEAMASGGTARDVALGKVAVGTSMLGLGGLLAVEGVITGAGPTNWQARKALEDTGWQPNSIKVGDGYFSYQALGGVGTLLGIAADLHELAAYWDSPDGDMQGFEDLTLAGAAHIASAAVPDVLTDDFGKVLELLRDGAPTSAWKKLADNFASSLTPNLFKQVNRAFGDKKIDTKLGAQDGAWESVVKPLKASFGVGMPQLNLFGEEVVHPQGTGPAILSAIALVNPFKYSPAKDDPIREELVRLGVSGPLVKPKPLAGQSHLMVDMPPRNISFAYVDGKDSFPVNLTSEQYNRFVELAAGHGLGSIDEIKKAPKERDQKVPNLKDMLGALIKSDYARQLDGKPGIPEAYRTDENKRTVIAEMVGMYRAAAKQQLLLEFPDIREQFLGAQVARSTALGQTVDRDVVENARAQIRSIMGISKDEESTMLKTQQRAKRKGEPTL